MLCFRTSAWEWWSGSASECLRSHFFGCKVFELIPGVCFVLGQARESVGRAARANSFRSHFSCDGGEMLRVQ